MQTYNPNNNQGNQMDNYQNNYSFNNSQYNAGPDNYYNAGNTNYDANYNYVNQYNNGGQQYNYNNQYGNGGQYGYNNQYGGQDIMNMNAGFEAGGMPVVSGMQGLKTLMAEEVIAKSFLFMVVALLITAGAALTTSPAIAIRMLTGNSFYILLFAELGIVLASNWALSRNNVILGGVLFAVYSYLTGVTFSILFLAFTGSSIAVIFIVTAILFGIMAVIGLVTKKDLTSAGNLLLMGLIGIILASTANLIFLKSGMVDTVICSVGVLIFVGLTAYDAQKIKNRVAMSDSSNVLSLALMGAFDLYLDFINIFLKLLRLFGKRK